jgi:hypothetical protein
MPSNEFFWDDLLLYLEEERVVPIIGQDLLTATVAGQPRNAYCLLGQQLMEDLKMAKDGSTETCSLSHVVGGYPRFREKRGLIYTHTRNAFDRLAMPIPDPLRLLAQIPAFRLFITTTFDPWMEQAINEERFGGLAQTIPIAFDPEHSPDITPEQLRSGRPIVFQLFGRICSTPHYAVTEEDMLEYLHHLQMEPPKVLCDELRNRHLLFIGNAFPDWLARFFIRTARGKRLIDQRGMDEFVVENFQRSDSPLVSFFHQFSRETNFYSEGTPVDFVRALHVRWRERHPDTAKPITAPQPAAAAAADAAEMADPWLFISYASQDAPAVKRLRDALDQAGFNVWVDLERLESGDDYTRKIRDNINRCSLFLPVISRNTESRGEGFFRSEWTWAQRRLERISTKRAFIHPVLIDDIRLEDADVPDEFSRIHAGRAPGGVPDETMLGSLQRIIRELARQERSAA